MASMMWLKILFAFFSIIIAWADIRTGAVPRIAFVSAFLFFIVFKASLEEGQLLESVIGVLIGLFVFLLVYAISGGRLGLADVWYSALIGLVLGPWRWYAAIGLACAAGAVYSLAVKRRRIPFIPFMALGSLVMIIMRG